MAAPAGEWEQRCSCPNCTFTEQHRRQVRSEWKDRVCMAFGGATKEGYRGTGWGNLSSCSQVTVKESWHMAKCSETENG